MERGDNSSDQWPQGLLREPCAASDYLAEIPVRGLHILCVDVGDSSGGDIVVSVFPNSQNSSGAMRSFTLPRPKSGRKGAQASKEQVWWSLRQNLEAALKLQNRTVNPWAIFTTLGEPIDSLDPFLGLGAQDREAALPRGVALVYEGGAFIWPGVRVGHTQNIVLDVGAEGGPKQGDWGSTTRSVTMQTLSMKPLVFSIDDFLSLNECDYIQKHASPHMSQSGVRMLFPRLLSLLSLHASPLPVPVALTLPDRPGESHGQGPREGSHELADLVHILHALAQPPSSEAHRCTGRAA